MKIGIISGSFNPIHIGHLIIANVALNSGLFDKILFVISNNPIKLHHPEMETFDHRANMVEISIENEPKIEVSLIEKTMGEANYTFDVLEKIQEKYINDELALIVGQDVVFNFDKWYRAKDYIGKYKLYVVSRFNDNIPYENMANFGFKPLTMPIIELSSSYIRKLIREAKNVRFLLPDKVYDYICKNKLYIAK